MALLKDTLIQGSARVTDTLYTDTIGTSVTILGGSAAPLTLISGVGDYREGLRIKPHGNWSDIVLGGNDLTADNGTSANSWFIGNNNGNFYITRNGAYSSSSAILSCKSNVWSWSGTASGTVSNVNVAATAPTASAVVGYLALSPGKTGSQALETQESLYLYDTVASGAISGTYLNIGKQGTYMGGITLHSKTNAFHGDLVPTTLGANRTWTLPNATGTIALTSSSITGNAANVTGTVEIEHGGTGETSAIAGITALGGPYIGLSGTSLPEGANINTYVTPGTYYSSASARTETLTGDVALFSGAGFKMLVVGGYGGNRFTQWTQGNSETINLRYTRNNGDTWTDWQTLVQMTAGDNIGDATTPIYVDKSGNVIAGTTIKALAYKDSLAASDIPTISITGKTSGTLTVERGGTGITTSTYKNAVVIGNSTTVTNALQTVRTAKGAFYSTGQDVKPTFGTLPLAQGGTGLSTLQPFAIIYGASSANGSAPGFSVLGPNGEAVRKFLQMTGNGSGSGSAPSWVQLSASDIASGTLPINRGGTNAATAAAARTNLGLGDAKIFYGTCDTAAGTTTKEVTCTNFTADDFVEGAMIYVKFDHTNSGAVGSLKLQINDDTNTQKNIKKIYNGAVSNLTAAAELQANVSILFTYNGTYWIACGFDYNSTYDLGNNLRGTNGANYIANSVLYRYQLVASVDKNTLTPFNNVSNAPSNTSKAILTSVTFDAFGQFLYYSSTGTVNANAAIRSDYLYYTVRNINLGYSFNITASVNALTAAHDVYLKVSPQGDGKVKLASATPLTQTLPTSDDGYWYIKLGRAVSATNLDLYDTHPVYTYRNNAVSELLGPIVVDGNISMPTTRAIYGTLGDYLSNSSTDIGGFSWHQNAGSGPSATVNTNDAPTNAWWYIMRNRHTNIENNYYTDVAIPFNDNNIYYKVIRNNAIANASTNNGWVKVLDELNYSSYALPLGGGTMNGNLIVSNTSTEASANVISGAGQIYLFSQTSTTGNRGVYTKNATNGEGYIISVDQNNYINHLADINCSLRHRNNTLMIRNSMTNKGDTAGAAYIDFTDGTMTANTPAKRMGLIENSYDAGTGGGRNMLLMRAYKNTAGSTAQTYLGIFYYNDDTKIAMSSGQIRGAVWNDYAEYRASTAKEPGRVLTEGTDGIMKLANERLMPACKVYSDTFGVAIGETAKDNTPIAVSGRVLAYPYRDRNEYHLGDAVCSAPNGTIDIMTREEIMMYPERIIGTVSEIPDYEEWACNYGGQAGMPTEGNEPSYIKVNGRIWIYVR